MALSNAERAQVRTALGYPATPLFPNLPLESTLGAVDADAEGQIRVILGELSQIDAALLKAATKHLAVKEIEGIGLSGEKELENLRREGSLRCARIALILGFQAAGDPYTGRAGSSGSFTYLP